MLIKCFIKVNCIIKGTHTNALEKIPFIFTICISINTYFSE